MIISESTLLGRMRCDRLTILTEIENECRILVEKHEGTDHLVDLDVSQIMIFKYVG